MSTHNPNCDNDKCTRSTGEVRVLPLGSNPHHGNIILCYQCFLRETFYRRERNRNLEGRADCFFALPEWETLKVYGSEVAA